MANLGEVTTVSLFKLSLRENYGCLSDQSDRITLHSDPKSEKLI